MNECQESSESACGENSQCINVEGGFTCRCFEGYSGDTCAGTTTYLIFLDRCVTLCIIDINECEEGSYSCGQNAECINTDGNYTCSCSSGYTGNGQTCTGVYYMYVCTCSWVYVFHFSSDIDECADNRSNNCAVQADCTNTVGSFICSCVSGYDGDGIVCTGW